MMLQPCSAAVQTLPLECNTFSLPFIKHKAASVLCLGEGGLILITRGEIHQTSSSGKMEMGRCIIHDGADTIQKVCSAAATTLFCMLRLMSGHMGLGRHQGV